MAKTPRGHVSKEHNPLKAFFFFSRARNLLCYIKYFSGCYLGKRRGKAFDSSRSSSVWSL